VLSKSEEEGNYYFTFFTMISGYEKCTIEKDVWEKTKVGDIVRVITSLEKRKSLWERFK
jgi:hypothetical protein